ncbi:MAG TPA: SPOR domain-containing protein [Candidatus Binatia bacterium]|nr:SPOR domain-containing protein [Candidatus Binatia bacterium]
MASSEDTEITLGTGKLLFLFFGLVGVCALFFALGYSLGRKSEPSIASASTSATPQVSSNSTKASGAAATPAQPMTFYKAVEQKDANAELTPPPDTKAADTTPGAATNSTSTTAPAPTATANPNDSPTTLPTSGYFVQVAAVSKQEDAQALVDALKKKDYPAFVAAQVSTDKLFRVQLGPFTEVKEAEATRTRLIGDGYSPILKK